MSDLLRTDARLPGQPPHEAQRDARIERLLLDGLDHYFGGRFDRAINLWTRVLFLDRRHDRARAYIERARSAQAEGQRESEVLLHDGLAAFESGDVATARRLVSTAIERGAPLDMALGILDRIERLDPRSGAPALASTEWMPDAEDAHVRGTPHLLRESRLALALLLLATVTMATAALMLVGLLPVRSLFAGAAGPGNTVGSLWSTWATAPGARPPLAATPLPAPLAVLSAADVDLGRAKTHFSRGRVREALLALDKIPIGNARRSEADRLRAEIQRELLAIADAELHSARPGTPSAPPGPTARSSADGSSACPMPCAAAPRP